MQDISALDRTEMRKLLKKLEDEFYGIGTKNPDRLFELILVTGPIQHKILKCLSYTDIRLMKQTCSTLLTQLPYIYCNMNEHIMVNGRCQCNYRKEKTYYIGNHFNFSFIFERTPQGKTIKSLKKSLGINDHPNRATRRQSNKSKNFIVKIKNKK